MRTELHEVPVRVRNEIGKSARKQQRAQGFIPAVVYGRELEENIHIAVEERVFRRALPESAWYSTPLKLVIQDKAFKNYSPTVMITEVQRDLVLRRILSIDFHVVSMEEMVHTHIPVLHVGESRGVKLGGILEHLLHEVSIEAKLTDIPESLEVDITEMDIGERLRVSDLAVPSGVKITTASDDVILLIAPPRAVEEVVAAPEATPTEPERIGEQPEAEE